MNINWKVRLQSKAFWLSFASAVLLLAQALAAPFGYAWDFCLVDRQVADIVNAVFALLAVLGVVVDPTTEGVSDSVRAMAYAKPQDGGSPGCGQAKDGREECGPEGLEPEGLGPEGLGSEGGVRHG